MGTKSLLKLALLVFLANHITCNQWETSVMHGRMSVYEAVIKNDADLAELDFSNVDEVEFEDLKVETLTVAMQSPLKHLRKLSIVLGRVPTVQIEPNLGEVSIDRTDTHTVEINPGSSYKTTQLTVVDNKLKRLPRNLSAMKKLGALILDHNQIETVQMADLNGLDSLEVIKLDHNKITTINFQAVLPDLLYINLNDNQITEISLDQFVAPKLQEFEMQKNLLETVNMSQFNRFTKLAAIQLDNNNILELTSNTVTLPKLQIITVGGNRLRTLDFQNWNTPALDQIRVENNRLKQIHGLATGFPGLRTVVLFTNPYDCKWMNATLDALKARKVDIEKLHVASCRDEASQLEEDLANIKKETDTQLENIRKLKTEIDSMKQFYQEGLLKIEQMKGRK